MQAQGLHVWGWRGQKVVVWVGGRRVEVWVEDLPSEVLGAVQKAVALGVVLHV